MNAFALDTTPVINPAVVSREGLDDGMVLVNCDTGTALSVNRTGALVWKLIDGRRNPEEIAKAVCRNFNNAPDTVMDDVAALLTTLAEDGFIGYEIKSENKDQTQNTTRK
ncbi:MAG: PqqD family protein [Methanoregula sp.]|nr:PqqD family protein [Methanoregula sp.]